jgi:hypothetical protein
MAVCAIVIPKNLSTTSKQEKNITRPSCNQIFTPEGSDHFDQETEGIGESRGFNQKRFKSSDDKMNDQVEESMYCLMVSCHYLTL